MLNNILISRETRKVLKKDNRFLGIDGENLQEVLVFKLDEEIDGNAVIEIQFRDETKGFIEVEKTERGYELPIKSSLLTQEGIIKMQLRILQSKLEVFKSEIIRFDVEKAINATATIPDEYPTWIDNLEILKSSLEKAETERAEKFTQMQKDTETAIGNIKDMTESYNANAVEKTNEYNENAKAKLDEYNANVQLVEPRIVELENENAILKNQFPTGQEEGENITITDSSDMEFKELRIGGNSWQETRSGKNILPITTESTTIDGVTLTVNEDKSITLNGTNIGSSNLAIKLCSEGDLMLDENTVYKLTGKSGVSGIYLQVTYYKDGVRVYATADGEFTTVEANNSLTNNGFGAYAYIRFDVGVTVNNLTIYPMITLASETDLTYEQFGQMPSPPFPSPIRNVGDNGSANITVCNKNRFGEIAEITTKGITSTRNNDNSFILNGIGEGNSYKYFPFSENIILQPGTYTISIEYIGSISNNKLNASLYDENMGNVVDTNLTTNTKIINKTIEKETILTGFRTWIDNGVEFKNVIIKIQIEEGTVSTEYLKTQKQVFTFPLAEGQRMYKDSYLADDGIHHKRVQQILTGSEDNWSWADTTRYAVKINNIKGGNGLCTHFKYNEYSTSSKIDNTFNVANGYIGFHITSITSLTSFKNYLAEQYANGTPVITEYGLIEEIIEPYTEEQQKVYNEIKKAHSYKNVTHIFSTDEIKPQIEVVYRKDLEIMFNKLTNTETVQEMIDNSVGSTIGGEY